jgi:hypothetical protein
MGRLRENKKECLVSGSAESTNGDSADSHRISVTSLLVFPSRALFGCLELNPPDLLLSSEHSGDRPPEHAPPNA